MGSRRGEPKRVSELPEMAFSRGNFKNAIKLNTGENLVRRALS